MENSLDLRLVLWKKFEGQFEPTRAKWAANKRYPTWAKLKTWLELASLGVRFGGLILSNVSHLH